MLLPAKPELWGLDRHLTAAPHLWRGAAHVFPFWGNFLNFGTRHSPGNSVTNLNWTRTRHGTAFGNGEFPRPQTYFSWSDANGINRTNKVTVGFVGVLGSGNGRRIYRSHSSEAVSSLSARLEMDGDLRLRIGTASAWHERIFPTQSNEGIASTFVAIHNAADPDNRLWMDGRELTPDSTSNNGLNTFSAFTTETWSAGKVTSNEGRCELNLFVVWDRELGDDEIREFSADPFALIRQRAPVYVVPTGAQTATLNAGSYTQTGNNLTATRSLTATLDAGSYSFTGQNLTAAQAFTATLDAGSYTFTGLDTAVTRALQAALDAGSYTHTGFDLTATTDATADLGAGSYTQTGFDITALRSLTATLDAGSYTHTGYDLTADQAIIATVDAGAYTFTGFDLTGTRALVANLDAGSYTWAGLGLTATVPGAEEEATVQGGYSIPRLQERLDDNEVMQLVMRKFGDLVNAS